MKTGMLVSIITKRFFFFPFNIGLKTVMLPVTKNIRSLAKLKYCV